MDLAATRETLANLIALPTVSSEGNLALITYATGRLSDCGARISITPDETGRKDISERLYYQTARIWLKSICNLDLAEEVTMFGREIAEIRAAVEIGDVSAAAYIRRSHISMSFVRLSRMVPRG